MSKMAELMGYATVMWLFVRLSIQQECASAMCLHHRSRYFFAVQAQPGLAQDGSLYQPYFGGEGRAVQLKH